MRDLATPTPARIADAMVADPPTRGGYPTANELPEGKSGMSLSPKRKLAGAQIAARFAAEKARHMPYDFYTETTAQVLADHVAMRRRQRKMKEL